MVWERPIASKKANKKSSKKPGKTSSKTPSTKPAARPPSCEMSYGSYVPGAVTYEISIPESQLCTSSLGGAPLPSGWTEHYDASSGGYFYVNGATNETTWDRPRPLFAGTL